MQTLTVGPLDTVQLTPLMDRTIGRPEIVVGLVDGPVVLSHPDLTAGRIQEIPGKLRGICARADSAACLHGTFVAGILSAERGSAAPAICPGCTVLVRPIYSETNPAINGMPSTTAETLTDSIVDCVNAGTRIVNLSSVLTESSSGGARTLAQALDYAASRGVITVAAAGNQGLIGNSVITGHPSVIPVAACDLKGQPLSASNLGRSIGQRGLMAPGIEITSLGANGKLHAARGTSAAAPFVTGAIALLWSEFPYADASHIRSAVLQAWPGQRRTIVPPLLAAWTAYQTLRLN
jgi:subtilisin family serine protease